MKYTDPSGNCFWDACVLEGAAVIWIAGAVTATVAGIVTAYNLDKEGYNVYNHKERSEYPPAARKNYSSKKDAYEAAKRAGKNKEPIHHPDGEHGPHYHPDVPKPSGPQTPKANNPHDHYYYPKSRK